MEFYERAYKVLLDQINEVISKMRIDFKLPKEELASEEDYRNAYTELKEMFKGALESSISERWGGKLQKYFPEDVANQYTNVMKYSLRDVPSEAIQIYNKVFTMLELADAGQIEDVQNKLTSDVLSMDFYQVIEDYGMLLQSYYAPEVIEGLEAGLKNSKNLSKDERERVKVQLHYLQGFKENSKKIIELRAGKAGFDSEGQILSQRQPE